MVYTVLNISSNADLSVENGNPETNNFVFSKLEAYLNFCSPKSSVLSTFLETNNGRPSKGLLSNFKAFAACSFYLILKPN
jgi:hypothetical protein